MIWTNPVTNVTTHKPRIQCSPQPIHYIVLSWWNLVNVTFTTHANCGLQLKWLLTKAMTISNIFKWLLQGIDGEPFEYLTQFINGLHIEHTVTNHPNWQLLMFSCLTSSWRTRVLGMHTRWRSTKPSSDSVNWGYILVRNGWGCTNPNAHQYSWQLKVLMHAYMQVYYRMCLIIN